MLDTCRSPIKKFKYGPVYIAGSAADKGRFRMP